MLSNNLRRALVLGTVSTIAIATSAQAATATAPTNLSYSGVNTACDVIFDVSFTGQTADVTGGDRVQFAVIDVNGNTVGVSLNETVAVGTTRSVNRAVFMQSFANLPSGAGPLTLTVFDTDASATRVATLAQTQIDLAALYAGGQPCQVIAQAAGYTPPNNPPVSDAGPDQTSSGGLTVQLDGTGSFDPDGDPITYRWNQINGPAATFSPSRSVAAPSFVVAATDRSAQTYIFNLVVSDNANRDGVDSVTVRVPANTAPVADAGADRSANPGDTIQLNAGGSTDAENDPLTYSWIQEAGDPVTLTNANSATPSFTIPANATVPQEIRFRVEVQDRYTGAPLQASQESIVRINVVAAGNGAPVADAGADRTVAGGATVRLDASTSTDPDGDPLTYRWVQTGGPLVTLASANSATPAFAAPLATPSAQVLTFEVTVTDPSGATSTDTVAITVAAQVANSAPDAVTGPDRTVSRGDLVTLSGAGSTDPDGDALTYSWQQTGGVSVSLSDASALSPTFTVPNVNRAGSILSFELTVTDQSGASDVATVDITVPTNAAPTPRAGMDRTVQGGSTVTLDASGSTDPDGDSLTYSWGWGTNAPALTNPNSVNPTFVAPAATATDQIFEYTLTVDDGVPNGGGAVIQIDTVRITVPAMVSSAPIADAGSDGSITPGATVTLDASGSSDPDGDPLTYSWTQVSGPSAAISDASSAQASFVAPARTNAVQTLSFEVAVSDGTTTSTDTVTYTIAANQGPIADAGTDRRVEGDTYVVLDGTGSSDPEGDTLTYNWVQTGGPSVTLRNIMDDQATFTTPAGTPTDQVLTFELTVSDGNISSTDTVTITVDANDAPVANAGPDQTTTGGEVVGLDGSASSDPENDTLSYSWVQTGGQGVTLSDATLARPVFTAPTGLASSTQLTFELTVDDGVSTSTDTVIIEVLPNSAPIADAGADIGPIESGQTVTLDGSASSDPDGDTITYRWIQTAGTSVTLSNINVASPSFTAPLVNGTETLEFRLQVSDGTILSTDTVRVIVQALGTVTIITNVVGADETVSFNSNVPGLAQSVTTSGGTGTIRATNVAAGSYSFSVDDLRGRGYALTALSCNDTDSTVSLADRDIDIALSPSEKLVCTIELSDTRTAAQQAIGEYLGGRNAMLLANQPNLQRRLARLRGESAGGGTASVNGMAVPGSGKLPVNMTIGNSVSSISSSLSTARSAAGRSKYDNRLDVWFEGSIADVTFGRNEGTFTIGYAGVDYRLDDNLLIGALVQYDRFNSALETFGAGMAEGDGWMAGPYVTARIAPQLYLDGRIAFGQSDNRVSSLGTSIDGFETDRLFGSGSVIGEFALGEGLTLWPELGVRYIRENVSGYTDSLGVAIPDARIDQGEVTFSPRLDYRMTTESGWTIAPFGEVEGLFTFGANAFSPIDNGVRARASLGIDTVTPENIRLGLSGFLDGIGEDRFDATGLTATVSFSF
ncbi:MULTISPECIES: PKD domain-containing protein [unclassified Erythrobacter]|uniref:PKD domain-containing protein n=1 Tax=unclassified Erythrobacter TaxID=2633097 RepID=UPI00076D1BBF|nr:MULTISPECIES: PKD domain-containing protein [unclassified Erythrobacter]KWV92464.1 hypothetical protein ASS64_14530 [Erythrobacter sp. AP23]MBO6766780.1 autotransporter domain-containing protein [Erythrobacter sp.]